MCPSRPWIAGTRHHKLGNPIFPLFADKRVLLHYTNWGCYSLLKAAFESSNTKPASSQPSLNHLVNYLSGLRPFVSYSFSMLIKSGIAANPACKNTDRKLEKIYRHQDLPRLKEKPLRDCLPNWYRSFLHFCCSGNKPTAAYISWTKGFVLTLSGWGKLESCGGFANASNRARESES